MDRKGDKINQVFQQYLQSDKKHLIEQARGVATALNSFKSPASFTATFVKERAGWAYISLNAGLGKIRLGPYKHATKCKWIYDELYGYLWLQPTMLGNKPLNYHHFYYLNELESLIHDLSKFS